MADARINVVAELPENNTAISAVQNTATMVAQYAKKLFNNERAQEFAARVSLLAKQDINIKRAIENTPDSFLTAMMACAQLDLMPNTPEQHAFIIAFGNKVQFQIGYRGLKELAYRSGEIKSINGEIVFEGDAFEVEFGTDRRLVHKPNFNIDRTDFTKATHAYITVVLANGEKPFFVMTHKEIEKIREDARQRNNGKDSLAWIKWWDQQALKTVMKRATKQLPSSSKDNRLAFAANIDSLAEAGNLVLGIDGVAERAPVIKPRLSDSERLRIQTESSSIADQLEQENKNE